MPRRFEPVEPDCIRVMRRTRSSVKAGRRQIIDMALRRAKPGAGSHLDTLREEGSDYAAGELVPDLGGVPYAVVGGLATARHMPQRMTLDTDILVAAVDRDAAEAAMARSGCEIGRAHV